MLRSRLSLGFTAIVAFTLLSARPADAQPQPSERERLEEKYSEGRAPVTVVID